MEEEDQGGDPPVETSLDESSFRPLPIMRVWWGSVVYAMACFVGYLGLAQLVPVFIIVTVLMVLSGSSSTAGLEEQLIPWLPAIVLWGAATSVAGVYGLRWLRLLPPTPPVSAGTLQWHKLAWVAGATVACLLGQEAMARLLFELGIEPKEQPELVEAFARSGVLFIIAVVILAPLGEELLFRRVIFSSVELGCGRSGAYAISAFLFAAAHGNFQAFLLYMWMGTCFAVAYERTGSVWGAITVHAINNGVALSEMAQAR